jgi:DNA-binding LacI/PurR family transcriptional regulator
VGTTSADLSPAAAAVVDSRNTSSPITGVVAYDLVQAARLRQLLQDSGVLCPRDVSIIAAEDLRFVRRMWPEFTGITCDRYSMGGKAAEMMLAKISAGGAPQPSLVFKGKFIEGSTCAPPSTSLPPRKKPRQKLKPAV